MSNDHLFQNQPQSGNHGNGTAYLGQQYTQYEGQEQQDTEFRSEYFNEAMHFHNWNRSDSDTSDSEFENPENITVDEGHNQDQDEDQGKYKNQAQQEGDGDGNDSNQDDHDGSNPFNYKKSNMTDFGTSESQAQIPENRTMDVRQEHDQYEDQGQQENKSIPGTFDATHDCSKRNIEDMLDSGAFDSQVEETEYGTTGAEKKPEDNEIRNKNLSPKQKPKKDKREPRLLTSRVDFIISIYTKELEAIRNRQQPHILQYRELPVGTRRVWLCESETAAGITHCATISPRNANDTPEIETKDGSMKAYKITQLHEVPLVSRLEWIDLRSRRWLRTTPLVTNQDSNKSYVGARSAMVEFLRPKLVKVFADEEEDGLEHGFTDIIITMATHRIDSIESQEKTHLFVTTTNKYPAGAKWVWIYEGQSAATLRCRATIDIPKEPGQLTQEDLGTFENVRFNSSKTIFNFAYRILGVQSIDCKHSYMKEKKWMDRPPPASQAPYERGKLEYYLAPEDMVTMLTPQLKPLW